MVDGSSSALMRHARVASPKVALYYQKKGHSPASRHPCTPPPVFWPVSPASKLVQMAAAAPVIRGEGTTADYLRQKASVKSIFDTFAKTDDSELNEVCWDALPEETLCSKPVYERFSYYLMHVHPNGTDSKGNPRHGLDGSTATK